MRTVEKHPVTHDRDYTTSVTCDRCGAELFRPYLNRTNPKWWENGGTVDGGEIRMSAGYGSIYDLDGHEFDICDDCWPRLLRWFRKAQNTDTDPEKEQS